MYEPVDIYNALVQLVEEIEYYFDGDDENGLMNSYVFEDAKKLIKDVEKDLKNEIAK